MMHVGILGGLISIKEWLSDGAYKTNQIIQPNWGNCELKKKLYEEGIIVTVHSVIQLETIIAQGNKFVI